jgi:A/G-specific adenine glycosylase
LRKAAQQIVNLGGFPADYPSILALEGVGDYTAAAVASIAFGLPHAVVDGNVRRVISRLTNHPDPDAQSEADRVLDRRDPGRWNQAVMELGALICLPREPLCGACPLARACAAQCHGTQSELPAKRAKPAAIHIEKTLLVILRNGRLLLTQGSRVAGFWDLPEPSPAFRVGNVLGEFRHTITHRHYRFTVREASVQRTPKPFRWWTRQQIHEIPLSTTAKKGLRCLDEGA